LPSCSSPQTPSGFQRGRDTLRSLTIVQGREAAARITVRLRPHGQPEGARPAIAPGRRRARPSLAVAADGGLSVASDNGRGQLGLGDIEHRNAPTRVGQGSD